MRIESKGDLRRLMIAVGAIVLDDQSEYNGLGWQVLDDEMSAASDEDDLLVVAEAHIENWLPSRGVETLDLASRECISEALAKAIIDPETEPSSRDRLLRLFVTLLPAHGYTGAKAFHPKHGIFLVAREGA